MIVRTSKISTIIFGRAILLYHQGLNWDEIASQCPPYTANQWKNAITEFLHEIQVFDVQKDVDTTRKITSFMNYQDTGCYKSPSCLKCPLPRCIYDTESKRGERHVWTSSEEKYLKNHYADQTVPEISRELGISESAIRKHVYIMRLTKKDKNNG